MVKRYYKTIYILLCLCGFAVGYNPLHAQSAMVSVYARNLTNLNGAWKVIIDPTGVGDWRQVWLEKKPQKKTDFLEYSFDYGPTFQVPGDFNTQMPELTYVEGVVWYKRTFEYTKRDNKRLFLHFGAVNYLADVYLNGKHLGSHEGGFTPFQFEITDPVADGINILVVKSNNQRQRDGLPGTGYDWFNYGGITRDVNLIETSASFIEDYSLQLRKSSFDEVLGWVKLNGEKFIQNISIKIPELKVDYKTRSNMEGYAEVKLSSKFKLWTPEDPKLYKVIIASETDTLTDDIGFRSIEVKGTGIVLNGKPIFLKGVNIHEERPFRAAKAWSESDALVLLTWAKEMGCNLVRLAHYPHSEHMVKLAEKMGLMVWDELPVYQHIAFTSPGLQDKMNLMMREMMRRDRNRCGVIFWSLSNETYSDTPGRDKVLIEQAKQCRLLDSTRLIVSVLSNQGYANNTFDVWDPICKYFDVISVNEYLGWYLPWQGKPSETRWKFVVEKPLIISEFGGESKFGSNFGPKDEAAYWSEEYQEQIYRDQVEMFGVTPNLAGVCPWILVDYRSLGRMHPLYQGGFNRKGLISEYGEKKKAWYVMKKYFSQN